MTCMILRGGAASPAAALGLPSHTAAATFMRLVPDAERGQAFGLAGAGLIAVQGIGLLVGALVVLGTNSPSITVALIAGAIRSAYRPTLLLGLVVLALVVPAAAAVGYLPRYRYPGDPLLAVLAAGGVCVLVTVGISLARRVSRTYRLSPAPMTPPGARREAA